MKNFRTSCVVVALAALGVAALATSSPSGQAVAHKATMKGYSVAPLGNTVVAFSPSFQGGVRVAVGDVNGDGQAMLAKLARAQGSRRGTITLTFQGQSSAPAIGRGSGNNLKQIGLGSHSMKELQFGFLKADGPGQMKEWQTFRATDVTLKRGIMNAANSNGKGDANETLTITFTGLEIAPAIGANGGVWKTTNFIDPGTGEQRTGLLLPAVQKIR